MRRPITTVAVAVVLGVAVTVSGCSSDDEDASTKEQLCDQMDQISADIDELASTPRDELSGDSVQERLDKIQADISEAEATQDAAESDGWQKAVDVVGDVKDELTAIVDDASETELGQDATKAFDDLKTSWSETVAEADCDPAT